MKLSSLLQRFPYVTLLLLFGCLFPSISGRAQTEVPAEERLSELKNLYAERAYTEAVAAFPGLLSALNKSSDFSTLAEARLYYAECLFETQQEDKALEYFSRSYQTVIDHQLDSAELDYFYLILQGLAASNSPESATGQQWYRRMGAYINTFLPNDRKAKADWAFAESSLAYYRGDFPKAVHKLETSLALGKEVYSKLDFYAIYNNLASIHAENNNFGLALSNQRLATKYAHGPVSKAENLLNEATIQTELRNDEEALRILEQAEDHISNELPDNSAMWLSLFHDYSYLYNQRNDFASFDVIRKREALFLAKYPEHLQTIPYQRYCNYEASYYVRQGDYEKSRVWLQRAEQAEATGGFDWGLYTSRLLIQAKLWGNIDQFDRAAFNFYLLLAFKTSEQVDYNAPDRDIHRNFLADSLPATLQVISLLKDRAALYARWGFKEAGIGYDTIALREIHLADQLLFRAREQVDQSGRRRLFDEVSAELRKIEVGIYWRLYQKEPSDFELKKAINASEQIKHLSISERLWHDKEDIKEKIPAELLSQERSYAHLHDDLIRRLRASGISEQEVNDIGNQIQYVRKTRKKLQDTLQQIAPAYVRERYLPQEISLKSLREEVLSETEVMLHFVDQDSLVYLIMIGQETKNFLRIRLPENLSSSIPRLIEDMRTLDTAVYRQLHDFHHLLITPIAEDLVGKDIVLVPDGYLNYLPFAALLTDTPPPGSGPMDYPYLLRNHEIRHLFSTKSALLAPSVTRAIRQQATYRAAAFAPFTNGGNARFSALPFSLNTVFELRSQAGSWSIHESLGGEATVEDFLRMASTANLLHIGTHAAINNEYPEESSLLFASDQSAGWSHLSAAEIPKLRLTADLVVISACQSADGRLYQGQGVANFARSFALAGASNLMVNLWEIRDETSHYLLKEVYAELYQHGKPKHQALRQAQLNYLREHEPTAHPAYWATMVYIGNGKPLNTSTDKSAWLMLPGILLVASIIGFRLIWLKRRAKNGNS
ncbi:CHAT domain-containing protein [Neolewinella persica]|uniref:CHAT domain-containing protein n=1 Tax=Neolewinella persica TaxID=70998 RepID=UPI00035CBCB7|nr:CHAT domain-containing protein [Neolewinella persica]